MIRGAVPGSKGGFVTVRAPPSKPEQLRKRANWQVELLNDQGVAASKVDVPDTVFGREYSES
jgi:hypothetical protein